MLDEPTIRAALAGDEDANQAVSETIHQKTIHRFRSMSPQARRIFDTDDAAQDAMVMYLEALKSCRIQFQSVKQFERLLAAMVTSACVKSVDRAMRKKRGGGLSQAGWQRLLDEVAPDCAPETEAMRAEVFDKLRVCVGRLSETHQAVLWLKHRRDMTHQQIKELLGEEHVNTVNSQSYRARLTLAKLLRAEGVSTSYVDLLTG